VSSKDFWGGRLGGGLGEVLERGYLPSLPLFLASLFFPETLLTPLNDQEYGNYLIIKSSSSDTFLCLAFLFLAFLSPLYII
jgi:hypothetical protein